MTIQEPVFEKFLVLRGDAEDMRSTEDGEEGTVLELGAHFDMAIMRTCLKTPVEDQARHRPSS